MKKLILFFTVVGVVALIAAVTMGCAKVDYGCTWDFVVVNNTESNIVLIKGDLEKTIKSEEEYRIYQIGTECGKNDMPGDLYEADDLMFNSNYKLSVNGKHIPNIVWKRSLWDFVNGVHKATYTLNVTDELIENIESQNEFN